jgi:hypothetical protein
VLHAVVENPDDTTQVSVIFANRCEEDILERVSLPQMPLFAVTILIGAGSNIFFTGSGPMVGVLGSIGFEAARAVLGASRAREAGVLVDTEPRSGKAEADGT